MKLKLKNEEIKGIGFTKIHRLRFMDEEPVIIETAYLPHNILPGIENIEKEYFELGSLYDLMEQRWGLFPSWSDSVLFARLTSEEEMKLFKDEERVPIIVSWKLILSQANQLIEITQSVFGKHYLFEYNAFRGS